MRRSLTAIGRGTSENAWRNKTRSSARLTNQRVSYAFTSSPLSFHECHILPTSNFQHSYSCILQASVNSMCENCESKTVNTVHWFDTSCSVIPVNNSITLISPVQAGIHGICDRNSVCLSVCHTRGLCPHGSTYDHDFFTTG